ncbi:MAG: ABC transporter ATP-binding protein [Actinomycetota bacterium]
MTYGSTVALDQVSVSLPAGETLAVVGPSGSGKTTLLRAVAGLEPLTSGSVVAGGVELADLATHERDLGLMFQDHALFPQLDVGANVAFGLRMQGWSRDRQRAQVGELLALMGLEGFERRSVHELSGGEAQRVALARALAPEPRLLMLDEPFGSLDRVLREQLTGDLRRLLDELGQTALHVTHDQTEAFALADRVAVLRAGRLEQIGTPEALWRRPASLFVAEFVGHPNRWMVEVQPSGELRWGPVVLGRMLEAATGAQSVVVPVSALSVGADGPLEVQVDRAVFVGGRYRVEARVVGGGEETAVVFEHDNRLGQGEVVRLAVDVDRLHLLGHSDGRLDWTK